MISLKRLKSKRLIATVLSLSIIIGAISPINALAEENANLDDSEVVQQTEEADAKFQEEYDIMIENELNGGNSDTRSVDQMLLKSQQWLNATYSTKTGFGSVPEDGKSRRSTVNACIRALQIELGITNTANNFGAGTISKFNQHYPDGIKQQKYPSEEESNVYGIIQCALWTKGYSVNSGSITKHFYDGVGDAIKELKSDMGFLNNDSTVTLPIMKSLLSMNDFVLVLGGSEKIRQIQQEINRNYPTYVGILPCDGLYTRTLNKALILVLQAIEGFKEDEATGYFGEGTKRELPLDFDPSGYWIQQHDKYVASIKLIQYALCCNGFEESVNLSNSEWNAQLSNTIKEFQSELNIEQTGKMNVDTWMALLLSKGNPDRSCTACDTRFEMTQERIDYLKSNGYKTVGRYLTGSEKGLKPDEPERIIKNGLTFFPIFQETLYTDTIQKYNYNLGVSDAKKAVEKAKELYIPADTIIYFAIDFDTTDADIQQYVIPYFKGVWENIGDYWVGIYGTRNACTQVMELGYAETCFVSDMSTGFSGNMGFKIPTNWNFDQFNEIQVTTTSGTWDLDKVSFSERFKVVTYLSKLGEFDLTGSYDGAEFAPQSGAKKMRYTIKFQPNSTDLILNISLSKHSIDTAHGINQFDEISHVRLNSHSNTEHTSDWLDISSAMGYRFSYNCRQENVQIENLPGGSSDILAEGSGHIIVIVEYLF